MASFKFVSRVAGPAQLMFEKLRVTQAKPGKVTLELPIEKKHINRVGSLHGGCICTLVDIGGSLAVASKGIWMTGVSVDLNTTFLSSGGSEGSTVKMDCTLDKLGRTVAFTTVEFREPETDRLLARGSHTKYVGNILKHELNEDIKD